MKTMNTNKIIHIEPLGFPWKTQDPFLFCAYHRDEYPKGNEMMGPDTPLTGRNIGQDFTIKDGWRMYHGRDIPGFPQHPHRGFETITIAKEGLVDHSDSLGAAGRFGDGDVQWMTAGKGVLHSEMFPLVHKDKGNPLEIFQVWLNLPKASKFVEPHFKMLWADGIPVLKEAKVEVNVIAGTVNNLKAPEPTPDSWAADPANGISILTIKIEAGGHWILPAATNDVNRNLYFYKGETIKLDGKSIPVDHSIQIMANESLALEAGNQDCYLLMLQGKPIGEPVAQYGPFVMNTQEEIREAYQDYQRTQFGGWPWPTNAPVHDRERGRFAKHSDGQEERK